MRPSITYFTSPPFFDNAIELTRDLSFEVELNLILLVSPKIRNASILHFKNQLIKPGIYELKDLQNEIHFHAQISNYLSQCKSVTIVIFSSSQFKNIKIYNDLFKLRALENRILHFDDVSGLGMIIMLKFFYKKIVLNVHDPIPHSGEYSLVNILVKKIAFMFTNRYVVFSKFASRQFTVKYGSRIKLLQLNLLPYTFYTNIGNYKNNVKIHQGITILFFGRISPYKGVQELIDAFNNVSINYKSVKLIIAGKGDLSEIRNLNSKIEVRNHFIDIYEMSELFKSSSLLVCPYRDATQSGVVMTARAFNIPVIVSNVGALPENTVFSDLIYDINEDNGLSNMLEKFIKSIKYYESIRYKKVEIENTNTQSLLRLYSDLI